MSQMFQCNDFLNEEYDKITYMHTPIFLSDIVVPPGD